MAAYFDRISDPSDRALYVAMNGRGILRLSPIPALTIVNDLVSLGPVRTSFNPAPVPGGPAGTFTITSTLTNPSATPILNPFFQVIGLSGGNLLINADGGAGGAGARLTPKAGADGVLSPNESVTVEFRIGLQAHRRFTFLVDLFGVRSP